METERNEVLNDSSDSSDLELRVITFDGMQGILSLIEFSQLYLLLHNVERSVIWANCGRLRPC